MRGPLSAAATAGTQSAQKPRTRSTRCTRTPKETMGSIDEVPKEYLTALTPPIVQFQGKSAKQAVFRRLTRSGARGEAGARFSFAGGTRWHDLAPWPSPVLPFLLARRAP